MIFDSKYIIEKLNKKLEEEPQITSEQHLLNLLPPQKDEDGKPTRRKRRPEVMQLTGKRVRKYRRQQGWSQEQLSN